MLEGDKGKRVLPIGKLPPKRERIIGWGKKNSGLPRLLRWRGDTDGYRSAPCSPGK